MGFCPFRSATTPADPIMGTPSATEDVDCPENDECQLWDVTLEMCGLSITQIIFSLGINDPLPPKWFTGLIPGPGIPGIPTPTPGSPAELGPDGLPIPKNTQPSGSSQPSGGGGICGTTTTNTYSSPSITSTKLPVNLEQQKTYMSEKGWSVEREVELQGKIYLTYKAENPWIEFVKTEGNNTILKVDSNVDLSLGGVMRYTFTGSNPSYNSNSASNGSFITVPTSSLGSLKLQIMRNG